ncbi:MAG: antibiotic ABC transporter ATP-binding protein [Bacteroidia bacterium]|nr:MAG: antibiotic ABC transporter ATP-binding protein [Bacteroidia bacterium]
MNKFHKILRYIFPYKYNVLANVAFVILSVLFSLGSFTMVIPFLGILFDNQPINLEPVAFDLSSIEAIKGSFNYLVSKVIVEQGHEAALVLVSSFIVIAVFLKTGFYYGATYVITPMRNGVVRDIRNSIYRKILQLPLGYYSNERKGDIMSRMTNDVLEIEVSVIRSIDILFKEPITIIIYLSSLFYMSIHLTVFVFILLPLTGSIIGRIGKSLRKKSVQAQTKLGHILTVIEETLSGLRIIKAFNSEERIGKRFAQENEAYTQIMNKMWRRRDLAVPLSEFLGTAVIVIVMWYGGRLVLSNSGNLSSQEFIAYLVIFSQIINPAKAFSQAYYNIQKGMASAERIDLIMEADIKIYEKEAPVSISDFKESIEFRNVSFKYLDEYVLKNINLKIEKGKTLALVGQSGSGKSTLVDLIPRFYDVVEGEILIDGKAITEYKIKDLRNLMGNVNQEAILFNDSIFNNIAFGVSNATSNEVEKAAKIANAHQFIMETPEQYETNIGDRGSKLSGGQRQRLSIARAVLKNPPIMILDEATSALDSESEKLVQEALIKLMKNRTSIVIAHRLSTIFNVDEIVVLHEGKIVEKGSHHELLKLNGKYKKLHDLQMFA